MKTNKKNEVFDANVPVELLSSIVEVKLDRLWILLIKFFTKQSNLKLFLETS